MHFPSNKTLGTIAVYGAFASITAVMWMRYKIEDGIRNTQYFELAMKTLRQHRGAKKLLGEPIKENGFDLGNEEKNYCDGQIARMEVNVRGPQDKGKMIFSASRNPENAWILNHLELEIKSKPNVRYVIKDEQKST